MKERVVSNLRHVYLFIGVIVLDQITKYLACVYLKPVGSVSLFSEILRLTYAENTGAAFSQFEGQSIFLIAVSTVFFGLIAWCWYQSKVSYEKRLLTFLVAGGFGNFIDRVYRGSVIDFIDVDFVNIYYPPFSDNARLILDRWPVFNVADICISISAVSLAIYYLLVEER